MCKIFIKKDLTLLEIYDIIDLSTGYEEVDSLQGTTALPEEGKFVLKERMLG
jgi:hypothetical protein